MPDREWWAAEWDRSDYDQARYQAAKAKLIELLGGKCVRCGSSEDLQFDHVERELKEFAITDRWNRSPAELQAELAKCQLLCREHHLEKTRSEVGVDHGGGVSGKRNCPCGPCRARKSEYNRNHRLTSKST
jgi:hypothetical protein